MEDAGRSTHLGNEIHTEQLCEGELFLHESAFHRDSFFLLFSRRKNRGMNGRTWPQCPAEFLREIIRRGQTNDTPYCALASRVKS